CFATEMKDSIKNPVSAVDYRESLQLSHRVQTQRSPLSSHRTHLDSPQFTCKITAPPSYNQTNTVQPNSKMRDA
ncbi:hypothetical protein M9458_035876, partial [Cirrhinus mrigala]